MVRGEREGALLRGARTGDQQSFRELIEPSRREILLYSYRLLGSLHDAEDLTQEALLRAWAKLDSFEGRSSFRAWLYSIATHLAFDAIDRRQRRPVTQSVASHADTGYGPSGMGSDPSWLEPLPDGLLVDEAGEPETRYLRRESVTLAFLVALQALPARQRAVLLLRDVLEWHAREVADLLELSPTAVESALHRARATLLSRRQSLAPATMSPFSSDAATQAVLSRYIHAWEEADMDGLVALLREDAMLAMPPLPDRYVGRSAIAAFFAPLLRGSAWRLLPTRANAQPAYVSYRREASGVYAAMGISVLTVEGGRVAGITSFLDPKLAESFGLPAKLSEAVE